MSTGAIIPAGLKAADIQRFAIRANQLQKFRPIVTYWCEYYILQQILAKKLHTADAECRGYALLLMDKLETFKQENPTNDAIVDDVAAKAYVENFALETFNRADQAQRSDAVTRQTADTFQAAATFFDLLSIWGAADSELAAKSKFAKYHALRIAKAIKAGQDPNETNPKIEPPPMETEDDGIEAELAAMVKQAPAPSQNYRQPYVESVTHDNETSALSTGGSASPPKTESDNDGVIPTTQDPIVSPTPTAIHDTEGQISASAGSYFTADVPVVAPGGDESQHETGEIYSEQRDSDHISSGTPTDPAGSSATTTPKATMTPSAQAARPVESPFVPSAATPVIASAPVAQPLVTTGFRSDESSVEEALKNAKWAVSALNYDDVETAVKYLRLALDTLGAR